MKNKSIIAIISVILVLIIAVGGFWVVKNQKEDNKEVLQEEITVSDDDNQNQKEVNMEENDTKNWQVYKNEEHGFEFKHPVNLKVKNNGDTGGIVFSGDDNISVLNVHIRTKELLTFEEINKQVENSNKEFRENNLNNSIIKTEIIEYENGLVGLKTIDGYSPHAVPMEIIYLISNGKEYLFYFSADSNNNILEYEDEIINSFRLIR